MARARSATAKRPRRAAAAANPATILAWEDDPGAPAEGFKPVPRPVPKLSSTPLPLAIRGTAPAAKTYPLGTKGFRYWTAAEALRRGADFWGGLFPAGVTWFPTNGRQLPVKLDQGQDLNAYYDRKGLHFFHEAAGGTVVYSGESPNVSCHELGHAILDALRPQLWDAASVEVASFHESFGDMSALLSALQLQSFRQTVLVATAGKLYRSSRLSRLAEQLGWAIRQSRPDLVDSDCLRNAVNSLFYRDPATLPPDGPAAVLSSEPHSFSRVFTAGFFQSLAGMFTVAGGKDDQTLLKVSQDAGRLLVTAILNSPVVPGYYSQVAAHMIEADTTLFAGRYHDSLQSAFVRHGVLSLDSAVAMGEPRPAGPRRGMVATASALRATATAKVRPAAAQLPRVALVGSRYGFGEDLLVHAPAEAARFSVASAAPNIGSVEPQAHDITAAAFVEDILRRGKVDMTGVELGAAAVTNPLARKTHELRRDAEGLTLVRRLFDCGFQTG
jgi:hypothetical protein